MAKARDGRIEILKIQPIPYLARARRSLAPAGGLTAPAAFRIPAFAGMTGLKEI